MTAYTITSSAGVEMGTYEGASAEQAIEAMHRDAGYASTEAAAMALGTTPEALIADLTVTEDTRAECAYCGQETEQAVPATEEEWDAAAEAHADDCEWVATRAHTREATCSYCDDNGCGDGGMPCSYADRNEGSVCECPECGEGCGRGWYEPDESTRGTVRLTNPCGDLDITGMVPTRAAPGDYYLIRVVDIGTQNRPDEYQLDKEPGERNLSHETCVRGWLGSYNDRSSYAEGRVRVEADGHLVRLSDE